MTGGQAILWRPPRSSQAPEHDALWNALVSRVGQPLPLVGRSSALLALGGPPDGEATALRLRFASGPRVVAVPLAFPFKAVCGADLAMADFGLLPPALRDALLDAVLAVILSALPPHPHGAAAIEAAGPWREIAEADPESGDLRWFRATLQGVAPEPVAVDLAATLPTLAGLFGDAPPARRVWGRLKADLTRDAYVTLGRLVLPLAAAAGLAPGGVAVMPAGLDPALAALRAGDALYRFRAAGEGWACLAVEPLADATLKAESHPMAGPTDEPPAGPLPFDIAVDFDIGRLVVPLAEIETWQPGAIVALQPAALREGVEVTLRSNGRVIGTGDLVTVDGRVAVRIASLAFTP